MSNRDVTLYIVDIFIAIDKIERYTDTFTNGSELLASELHWDATIRELEIIGEATKYLLENKLIEKHYRRVVDFRNQIAHGYFGIDETIVWDVVVHKLVEYKRDLNAVVIDTPFDLSHAIRHAREEFSEQKDVLLTLDRLVNSLENTTTVERLAGFLGEDGLPEKYNGDIDTAIEDAYHQEMMEKYGHHDDK